VPRSGSSGASVSRLRAGPVRCLGLVRAGWAGWRL